MALRRGKRDELVAQIVKGENKLPCAFCKKPVDDELNYGKFYAIGDIQCHYFCALLSCCLVQRGKDDVGLFGFLYQDILAEVSRAKKHKCSYCLNSGANMGCSVSQCRKQFHLPCGRERNAVSLFYGTYKSYCQLHSPKQKIPETIMAKARLRKRFAVKGYLKTNREESPSDLETVCVICYEEVPGYPTTETFWPPCCAKDAWFHRTCLQRMSLSAGMHYLKCPLCNDKESFCEAVVNQGYYVPDRDAAWELEGNAFAEIYERAAACCAADCQCPEGRSHDADNGPWDIKLCILCGSTGIHTQCQNASDSANASGRYVCATCQPAAPTDLDSLAESIEAVILAEQSQNASATRRGPLMPSRMSLRRTKGRALRSGSSTSMQYNGDRPEIKESTPSTTQSREELNLKPPKRQCSSSQKLHISSSPMTSPIKLLEQSINEESRLLHIKKVLDKSTVARLKRKLQRPRPLSAKRRIVNNILDGILSDVCEKEKPKEREPLREWCSPKKCEINQVSTTKHEVADKVLEPYKFETNNIFIDANPKETNAENDIEPSTNKDSPGKLKEYNDNVETLENDELHEVDKRDEQISPSKHNKENTIILKHIGAKNKKIIKQIPEIDDTTDILSEEMSKNDEQMLVSKKNTVPKHGNEERNQILNTTVNIDDIEQTDENSKEIGKEAHSEVIFVNNNEEVNADVCVDHNETNEDSNCHNFNEENWMIKGAGVELHPAIDDNIDVCKENNKKSNKCDNVVGVPNSSEIFPPAKNLKTINIEIDSAVEISKDDHVMHIDVVKMDSATDNFKIPIKSPVKNKKCFIKFSATDKEVLQNTNFNLDLESFKNHYLSEVDGERAKNKTSANLAEDVEENRKRKLDPTEKSRLKSECKRRKEDNLAADIEMEGKEIDETLPTQINNKKRYRIKREANNTSDNQRVSTESKRKKKQKRRLIKNKRIKKSKDNTSVKLRLKNKNNVQVAIDTEKSDRRNKKTKLSVKIKWREERLNLRITESKRKKKIAKAKKCFKQYVLNYNDGDNKVIAKPEGEISPPKKKYVKQEKPQDKLVQMSIERFFKKVP